jgi:hypothetical protein
MRILRLEQQLLFRYSGNLQDTAALVGFKNMRAQLGKIVYCGERSFQARRYLAIVNEWLAKTNLPKIEISGEGPKAQEHVLVQNTLRQWGWGREECAAAIRLAGLPLPPCPANTTNGDFL